MRNTYFGDYLTCNVESLVGQPTALGKQSGFESPGGNGPHAQSIGEELWKLSKVAAKSGLNGVITYAMYKMGRKIWTELDEAYGLSDKAAAWGEKAVNGFKSRTNLHSLFPSASFRADHLAVANQRATHKGHCVG